MPETVMNQLLLTTTVLLLLFVGIEPSVAKPRNPDPDPGPGPDPDPDPIEGGEDETLNGSPEDNGHLSGKAEQAKFQQQERQRQEDDLYETEMPILKEEIAFLEWAKEFREIGEPPNMTPTVAGYMKKSNLTMADVTTIYVNGNGVSDRKRSAAIAHAGVWNKCIIPYTLADNLRNWHIRHPGATEEIDVHVFRLWEFKENSNVVNAEANIRAAQDAMKVIEKNTGFRFYPYNNSNAAMGLGHPNYLKFSYKGGCNAVFGNKMTYGQDINACGTVPTAIHELGHALGMLHEQATPGNWPFLDVKYQESQFPVDLRRNNLAEMYQSSKSYDAASVMHYAPWALRKDYIGAFSVMDLDFHFMSYEDNYFYFFKAIQEKNRCYDEFPSCSPLPKCEWEGYPSVIGGKCQCRCPEGLDPATGCTTVKPIPPNPVWPKGKYSFLKTNVDPCPEGFATGTMYSNPAWDVWDSSKYHFDKFDADEYAHHVCTKTEDGAGDPWPAGRYCIHRYGGTCPDGFESGLADTYGEVPTKQDVGTVPDGEHGQLFEYIFCCRNDGDLTEPMRLPFKSSFILYLGKDWSDCQEVEGMNHVRENYYMRSDIDKHTHRRTGSLTYLWKKTKWTEYIYYCAYFPETRTKCSVAKTLTQTEKTYTFTTPNFPNNYPNSAWCTWYIRSPEGSRIQLDFTTFEVPHSSETDCQTYVSVKSFRPGSLGFKFCGHNYQKTHWTYKNYLTVDFFSDMFSKPGAGFSATVRAFTEEDKCYKGDGRDRSYAGKVTYDKDFNNCLPWSRVKNCPFHQFDSRFADNDLAEHNYCRNIGIAGQPWCYTNAERCSRQNCDACMTGNCFDLFDDCQTLMTADSSFCIKNTNGEASRGCKKSCGECAKQTEISAGATCGAPPVVKGISPTQAKETYKVGDIVTYKCPSGTDWRESVCTSEGKWTPLKFICGACPSGWAAWKGKCFKYLDWDTNVDYPTAVRLCANFSAHIIQVDSMEKQKYFESLTDYYTGPIGNTWLGLTKDTDGKWVWPDGSQLSWKWWEWYQPDDTDKEKCVMTDEIGYWHDKPCTDKANVICEYTPTGPFLCEDQISNCDAVIRTTPDVCTAYPDYAWANCRKSCAIGDCSSSVTCRDDANIGDTGSRVVGDDTIALGQIVKYKCAEGYYHVSGDLTRGCLPSGSLTGSTPVCSNDAGLEIELFDKQPHKAISPRNYKFVGPWTYLTTNGGMTFPRAGKVTSWTFYSHLKGGEVAFQIFRPSVDPKKNLTMTFIGQNHVTSLPDLRIHTVQIPAVQQVSVQKGDIYGIWLKSAEISYDSCSAKLHKTDFDGFMYPLNGLTPSEAKVGKEYTFKDMDSCRMIGVKATFKIGA